MTAFGRFGVAAVAVVGRSSSRTHTKDEVINCRLLYLLGQLRPGGQERQLYYLLKAMDRHRFHPAIAVWNYSTRDDTYLSDIERLGVSVYPCSDDAAAPRKVVELRRLVGALRPEIVHSYCFYMNIVAWSAVLGTNGIPIGSIRQDFIDERWRLDGPTGKLVGGLSARLPAVQIFNSGTAKLAAEQCRDRFKPTKMYVVRNGIDVAAFEPHPPVNSRLILAAGRLEAVKRWDRLLAIVSLASARGMDFSLRIAGDGPLRSDLELQAKKLDLNGRVEFLGRRQDIPRLLQESSFLVHTADAEGCPNVVLEAMAAGRAVVATDAGDVAHLVEDGRTGFVVRRGDDLGLVNCITMLLNDSELSSRMGQAGRKKAEREFGLDRLVANTLAAYRASGWHG